MWNDEDLIEQLRLRGYEIGSSAVRSDGVLLYQINDVFMFRQDAVDLATGSAHLVDVVTRNRGPSVSGCGCY